MRTEELLVFLVDALGARRRVLAVGKGDAELARHLGAAGFSVTSLEAEQRDPRPAHGVTYVEGTFLGFEAEPFDAIVFAGALHAITPLEKAIAHAARLLVPSGLLIADEFDLEAADVDTLRWYFELQELLGAAALFRTDAPAGAAAGDVLARWRAMHAPSVQSGSQLRLAISEWFAIRDLRRCDYLHRSISSGLPQDERGLAIAKHVQATERRKIAEGALVPVGLRIVASLA